jgi:hypothetical protein
LEIEVHRGEAMVQHPAVGKSPFVAEFAFATNELNFLLIETGRDGTKIVR